MPSTSHVVTLECAGNGRYQLEPRVDGEQWRLGAVSTAEWTGVPLVEVLDRAGIRSDARELVFRGADRGVVDGHDPMSFERSLVVDTARESEAILAYAMNGEALPVQHGYPVRLVVPGWYGVASVKWLVAIDAVGEPFEGYYQHEKYWYEWPTEDGTVREPVTRQRVRALITEPADGGAVPAGEIVVRGVAWSGDAPLARVDVRVDDGEWRTARIVGDRHRHGWQWWELGLHVGGPGATTIRARATDQAGNVQPERPQWNALGYGNNAIQRVTVRVDASD
jgi:DMSO/TMAO reductase YedYZ molybdopterin-dependent catalytic subunit